eukprot:1158408-Pelagomonas_calceolata.AAC.2
MVVAMVWVCVCMCVCVLSKASVSYSARCCVGMEDKTKCFDCHNSGKEAVYGYNTIPGRGAVSIQNPWQGGAVPAWKRPQLTPSMHF